MGFNYIDIMELTTYSGDQKTYGYHKHDGSEREVDIAGSGNPLYVADFYN